MWETALDSGTVSELKAWIFANVIRSPKIGDVYTLWHDDHVDYWNLHGITEEGRVLFLTDGYNCTVYAHEWEDKVRSGQIRFTGRNHLWQ